MANIPRGPAETRLGTVRLANVGDAPQILELLTESISQNFRVTCTYDIIMLIENCILSICQLNLQKDIVGFLAARDHPLLPSVHPCAWEEYVWAKYKVKEMNSRNTLFLHMLCWNPKYGRDLVDNMLRSMFMHDAYILHIALIKSLLNYPLLIPGQARAEASFKRVTAMERGICGDNLPVLCIAERSEVCPRLKIRRAVEEDNDDLVPILEQHSERLRQFYGDFYISELIAKHSESDNVLLVCEHSELAVGVMCLSTTINYESLEDAFVLLPFGGLKHVNKDPEGLPKSVESNSSLILNVEPSPKPKQDSKDIKFLDKESNKSRVTWVFEGEDAEHFKSIGVMPSIMDDAVESAKEEERKYNYSWLVLDEELLQNQSDILNLFRDEEEEFEFDIINIDTNLLRVPEMVIYDAFGEGPADSVLKMIDGKAWRESSATVPEKKPDKPKKMSNIATVFEMPQPVRFSGTPNAFILELFAIHPNYDERYGFDMLEVAYELFPDRDYCVVCLPTNQPAFPLLEHFTLVTPYSCKRRYMNESLYVAHVNSIRGRMSVRPGEACDLTPLKEVLENSPRKEKLLELFQNTLITKGLQSYTLLSENQPVGVVVLGPLDNGASIRTHYDLEPEPRQPGHDAAILVGVLSPAFEPHSRWFLRELLRYSQYSTLFWICKLFAKGDARPSRNLMSLASHMNPVHPRVSLPNISGNKQLEKVYQNLGCPFALWVCERPLTSLPKVDVNTGIVVVGASRTGLAFLETLLLGPSSHYLTFSNVTLVSEHGVPDVGDCLKAADICVPKDGRYTDRYLKCMPFYYYLDIIKAVMVKIDRKRKCIHLKGGGFKFYDELVLTCGKQFQHPDYLKESLALVKEVAKGKPCERGLLDDPKHIPDTVPMPPEMPENVFLISSLYEANLCLRRLMRAISDAKDSTLVLSKDNQVIVYGDHIEAYSCIAALMELGLTPEMIVFVEPFPSVEDPAPMRVNCFNDETIDARVQATVEKLGIRVLRQTHLVAWHQIDNRVESIDFMAPLTSISLRSFALFYYGLRAINLHAFKAINESGLVYDGGLVVGPTFETNDPRISGAGTCVRYSRRLFASRSIHRHHCSEDIGEALGRLFLQKLDPFMMGDPDFCSAPDDLLPRYSSSTMGFSHIGSMSSFSRLAGAAMQMRRWQPVMKFESPLVKFAILPGPLYYLKLRKPGQEIPMAIQQSLPRQGHNLVTDKNDNYFLVHLNVLHVIDGVTCLSHKNFCPEIFKQLYGKHEAFFNKLYTRYQKNQIEDFYEFFTQPWMSALYQETYRDLVNDINDQDIGTIKDLMKSKFAVFDSDASQMKSALMEVDHFYGSISSISSYLHDPRRKGTFRSVINKFIAKAAFTKASLEQTDIPSECGQSKQVRSQAASFWNKSGGERIVMAHVSQYIEKNYITNPHFATPKPDYSPHSNLNP